ncbi:MAG: LptF/LptG family permease [Deltaproteobacteria bacterium]|jgi:lipopolysaccharide export system permease protein|nr:LptF/LptG family permease [Deltaproteobacteria bacterium]
MYKSIIKRSILWETIPSFLIYLAVFTFILLMARIMSLADLVVTGGVSTKEIIWIFLLVMPKMLSMSIPMASLLAPLTTFLRMSADSEITVLKASGVSLYQLLPPVLWFGLVALLLTGFFNIYLTPISNLRFRSEILVLAKARADLAIREQVFVRDFPGLTIYVGQLHSAGEVMTNIVINDKRLEDENTFIVAQEGILDIDHNEGLLLFRLISGVIDRVHKNSTSVDSIFFDTYELKLSPGPEFSNEENSLVLGRSEFPTDRLIPEGEIRKAQGFQDWYNYPLEYHRRFAFPVAALIMALIGMTLGASFRTRGRNFGLVVGLFIFIVYYSVFSIGWSLGTTGLVPPGPAVWFSNVLALITALLLLKGINRSAAIDPEATIRRIMTRIRSFNLKKAEANK